MPILKRKPQTVPAESILRSLADKTDQILTDNTQRFDEFLANASGANRHRKNRRHTWTKKCC